MRVDGAAAFLTAYRRRIHRVETPALAKRSACARPMPPPEPVTMTILPSNRPMACSFVDTELPEAKDSNMFIERVQWT